MSDTEMPQGASDESGSSWSGIDGATLTLMTWLIFLTFGGGLLAMYYAKIGYLPDFEWHEALNYLAVLSILGGGVVLIFGLLLVVPGLIWSEILISGPYLEKVFRWRTILHQPCARTCLKFLIGPFAIFMLVAHLNFYFLADQDFRLVLKHIGPTLVLFGLVIVFYRQTLKEVKTALESEPTGPTPQTRAALEKREKANADDCKSLSIYYTVWFSLSFAIAYCSLAIIYTNTYAGESEIMSFICTVSVTASSMVFVLTRKNNRRMAFGFALVISALLLVSGEKLVPDDSFSTRFMKSFGFGDCYTVVVTEKGHALIEAAQLGLDEDSNREKKPEASAPTPEFGGKRIENVFILSRLGSHFAMQRETERFYVPKQEVISWAKTTPKAKTCSESQAADKSKSTAPGNPTAQP